jgi:large subunit ribosomal protein L10
MNRTEKAAVVEEVAGQLSEAEAVFAVDYRGITVRQVAELRSKLRDVDTKLRVVKNSLGELAADKAGQPELKPFMQGPTALALVRGDIAVAAKALNDTQRQLHGILEFKGGTMNGEALTPAQIVSIARLPSRDILNAQLVGAIASPLTGLVRTLNALIAGLAIQLQAIADQGLVTGTAPVAPAAVEPVEPEPEAAAEPEPEPEPEAAAEPEPEPEAAAEPEPEPEAAAEPEPEPEAAAEPEPEPEAAAEPEAVEPEAAAEPEVDATEPETNDGEAASDAEPSEA